MIFLFFIFFFFQAEDGIRDTSVTGVQTCALPILSASQTINGFRDIRLTAGRMPNPLVTTLMVWDADINPEGLAQQWKHTYNLSFGGGTKSAAVESYSKDGKNAVAAVQAEPFKVKLDLFVNLGQFVYDDANPENPLGARAVQGGRLVPNTDAWMFAWQIGAKLNFPNNVYFQVAPVLYNYSGEGDSFS